MNYNERDMQQKGYERDHSPAHLHEEHRHHHHRSKISQSSNDVGSAY